MAEVAPDPPGLPRSDTLPAAFQQDSPRAAETPAETTHGVDPARQLSATAPVAAVRQAPAPGTHGWPDPAAAVAQAPAPSTHGRPDRVEKSLATSPPAAHPSPPTAPAEPAEPLGLGSHNGKNGSGKRSSLSAMITVGGSLAIVLGLFLIVAWAMRKTAPRGSLLLPKEVFEILGRAPLGARQQVQLLRCGNKLLLVSITPGGTETLTEVTDPLEVDRIAGICQQAHPKSATTAFRQVFQQLAPGTPGAANRRNSTIFRPWARDASAIAGRKTMPERESLQIENCKLKIANWQGGAGRRLLGGWPKNSPRPPAVPGRMGEGQGVRAVCNPSPSMALDVSRQPFHLRTLFVLILLLALAPATARAEDAGSRPLALNVPQEFSAGPEKWVSPEGLSSTIQVMLLLTVLSLAPAILLMTTCFVRVAVVLSMLRQALGTQTLPPNQVLISLAMFITLLGHGPDLEAGLRPVDRALYEQADRHGAGLDPGAGPIRQFMSAQIERTGNTEDVLLFWKYASSEPAPAKYDDVPLTVLLPAYMLSELKTAFLIGFQIYLPFLILDMVIASVMVSMGMLMLPPTLVSLPFKILLFVLVDGWHLVVGMLMQSFQVVP